MQPRLEQSVHFLRYLVKRFFVDNCMETAAALTYTTLFAVVPIMTVTYAMLAVIPQFGDVGGQIEDFIFQNFVPSTGEALRQYLFRFSEQARQLTGVGIATLMITAFIMMLKIESSFNDIWHVRQRRRGISSFLLYWAVLSLGPLLLGAGFAVSTYIASMSLLREGAVFAEAGRWMLRWVPLLLSMTAFTLTYMAVPNTRVPFKHALAGGVLVALLFESAKAIFGLYLRLFPGYELIYGAFSAFPVFLLWIFISWLIILFGAELVANLANSQAWKRPVYPRLVYLLGLLRIFLDAHSRGQSVHLDRAKEAGWEFREDVWLEMTDWLESERIITRVQQGGFVLSRDLAEIDLADFLAKVPEAIPGPGKMPRQLAGDPAWYPPFVAAVTELENQRRNIMCGSLKSWLCGAGHAEQTAHSGSDKETK
ncbi:MULTISPECIES: YihY family inner membrane protein [Pseudomonas]|uniref:YihY family inner membrane protein n=1 Tax=Pseudomonas TaxID=286 RepID=UPI0013A74ADC|nr:YihY family inner membrane protein [Pseudomonas sp. OIL-1]QIB51387.1 YihY family inner membrane protein [Pseudomonas sp. OIL-1]